jgi:hypothetical protein
LSDVTDEDSEIVKDEEISDLVDSNFLDDGAPAPALSDSEESSPVDIPIEDTVEEKLSFFDEDDEPGLDDPVDELDDSASSVDQTAESQLAFLDDDISATSDLEEMVEDDVDSDDEIAGFFDDDAPVAALSDSDESPFEDKGVDDAIEEKLSFFDDETPAPAFSSDVEEGGESASEELAADPSVEEDDTEKVIFEEESLAEEDETNDVAPDTEPLAEEDANEEVVLEEVEETPLAEEDDTEEVVFEEEALAEEDDIEEVIFEEESVVEEDGPEEIAVEVDPAVEEENIEEELSFVTEEPDVVEEVEEGGGGGEESVSISVDEESDESIETEEIEFTVPGQLTTAGVVAAAAGAVSMSGEKETFEDVIDFEVPGEDDDAGISLDFTDEAEEELVIFEAVDDDVEVDPLPGEEYADKTAESVDEEDTLEFFTAEETDSQSDSINHEAKKSVPIDYSSLSGTIQSLKGDATNTNLQALFAETNKLRAQNSSNTTGKIFLQLLSTISQHVERNIDDPDSASLKLMDDVYSGLQMSSASDASAEQIQQKLLTCTSQVVLLQQKDILNTSATGEQQKDVEGNETENSSAADEKLVSFVQGELADIRQLFLDEIRSLRNEIVDK